MADLEEHLDIDKQKVINSVRLQMPVEVTTYTLPRNMEAYFRSVEDMFLEVCHQEHLKEYLNFCLGELLSNSKKANTKRVYFIEKHLDINDPDDYANGMEHFKEDTFANLDYYLELQKKAGLYIKLSLQLKGDKLLIEIRNNSVLTSFEEERIQHKLETAQQYDDMDEVVANVIDQSEGAGLGIIIIILMLQKVGLSRENFKIFSTDTETVTQIILPCDKTIYAGVEIISYEFVNLQTKIPVLQNHFDTVNKLVQSPVLDRNAVLDAVRGDVTLTLLTFKYALEKDPECFSIMKALELLSDAELKFVFSDSNPTCEFIQSTEETEKLWEHAKQTAFYSYNLYKNDLQLQNYKDDEYCYLLGLFNSIGKVLLNTASEEQKQYIKNLSNQYDANADKILDVFTLGNASNYLTQIYMKKFGFSEEIASNLSNWNNFESVSDETKSIIKVLYLAEMISYYDAGIADFYQIRKSILSQFNITTEEQFKIVLGKLKAAC